jgi:hypothetical protein
MALNRNLRIALGILILVVEFGLAKPPKEGAKRIGKVFARGANVVLFVEAYSSIRPVDEFDEAAIERNWDIDNEGGGIFIGVFNSGAGHSGRLSQRFSFQQLIVVGSQRGGLDGFTVLVSKAGTSESFIRLKETLSASTPSKSGIEAQWGSRKRFFSQNPRLQAEIAGAFKAGKIQLIAHPKYRSVHKLLQFEGAPEKHIVVEHPQSFADWSTFHARHLGSRGRGRVSKIESWETIGTGFYRNLVFSDESRILYPLEHGETKATYIGPDGTEHPLKVLAPKEVSEFLSTRPKLAELYRVPATYQNTCPRILGGSKPVRRRSSKAEATAN